MAEHQQLNEQFMEACSALSQRGDDSHLISLRKQLSGKLVVSGQYLCSKFINSEGESVNPSTINVLQFHAAALLVHGIVSEHANISSEDFSKLIAELLQVIFDPRTNVANTKKLSVAAKSQLVRALGLALKLSWIRLIDTDDIDKSKNDFFEMIFGSTEHLPEKLEILEAIVEEHMFAFESGSSTTGLNIPSIYHVKARESFILFGWQQSFEFALKIIQTGFHGLDNSPTKIMEIKQAVKLARTCLNDVFLKDPIFYNTERSSCMRVIFGDGSNNSISFFMQLYAHVRSLIGFSKSDKSLFMDILNDIREVFFNMVTLLEGKHILQNEMLKQPYIDMIFFSLELLDADEFKSSLRTLTGLDTAFTGDLLLKDDITNLLSSELQFFTKYISSLISTIGADYLIHVYHNDHQRINRAIDQLASLQKYLLSLALIASRKIVDVDLVDDSLFIKSLEFLFEALGCFCRYLIQEIDLKLLGATSFDFDILLMKTIRTQSFEVYKEYLTTRLLICQEASSEANFDEAVFETYLFEDESILENHLQLLSIFFRTAPSECLKHSMDAFFSIQQADFTYVTNERIFWIAKIVSYALADNSSSETPMVPKSLFFGSPDFFNVHDVLMVVKNFILFLETQLSKLGTSQADEVSPLVLTTYVSALSRLLATYLCSDVDIYKRLKYETIPSPLEQFEKLRNELNPEQILEVTAMISIKCISESTLETEEQLISACMSLMRLLVKSTSPLTRPLASISRFAQTLVDALARPLNPSYSWGGLSGLPGSTFFGVTEVIFLIYFGSQSLVTELEVKLLHQFKQRSEYFVSQIKLRRVPDALKSKEFSRELSLLSGLSSALRRSQSSPELVTNVLSYCLVLIGSIGGSFTRTDDMNEMFSAQEAYKVFSSILEDHLIQASETHLKLVLSVTEVLLGVLVKQLEIEDKMSANDEGVIVSALNDWTRILKCICDKTLLDFSSEFSSTENDNLAGQVVFQGLAIIISRMKSDVFLYDDAADNYFNLLFSLVQFHSELLYTLDLRKFENLVQTLEYGIKDVRKQICKRALETISCFAEFHTKLQRDQNLVKPKMIACFQAIEGSRFFLTMLIEVLRVLLTEPQSDSLLEPFANSLFGLILCSKSAYDQVTEQVANSVNDLKLKSEVRSAFDHLTNDNNVQLSFDRANKAKFRSNVRDLISRLRGLLRYF